jgi:osmotically inducible protein OsmC
MLDRVPRLSSYLAIAEENVTIGKTDAGTFGLSVALRLQLHGVDRIKAEQVVAAAHQRCPYSNAIRGNIDVKLVVE